jgi:hypothetical protein
VAAKAGRTIQVNAETSFIFCALPVLVVRGDEA